MRPGVLLQTTSRLMWFVVVSLAFPLLVSVIYLEPTWWAFAAPMAIAALLAIAFARHPTAVAAPRDSLRRREGFFMVVSGWLFLVLFTAIAFNLTGSFPGFADSWFESMSGFTTTGATVISDIEALPKGVLFARSFAHWLGGMGIIVLSVAILPQLAVGGMQLFAAEASGIDSEKLAPRIAATARRLWVIYVAITIVLFLVLLPAMSVFDSINHAFATVATGGFSTNNDSLASSGLYVEIMIMLFMFISGVNFTLQYKAILQRQPTRLLRSPEAKLYTLLTLVSILLATYSLYGSGTYESVFDALRYGSFQVVSIITTTGFGTANFDEWPHFCRLLLVGLMLIGGCAGSTAGGSKVIRLYVVIVYAIVQLRRLIRPRLVQPLYIGDRHVPRETMEGILGFYLLYFAAIMLGGLAMTAIGLDLESGITASVSAMNSIGPGLGSIGAIENFGHLADSGKYILSFGMLLGRLEIYPVLVIFTFHFWRRG